MSLEMELCQLMSSGAPLYKFHVPSTLRLNKTKQIIQTSITIVANSSTLGGFLSNWALLSQNHYRLKLFTLLNFQLLMEILGAPYTDCTRVRQ